MPRKSSKMPDRFIQRVVSNIANSCDKRGYFVLPQISITLYNIY